MSYFSDFYNTNVENKISEKNGLKYLPWAYAWAEIKKAHPFSYYTVYENEEGKNYFTDGNTCWVKTGVTVVFSDDTQQPSDWYKLEHIESLPVMDHRNHSIAADKVVSTDINKSIQRSLTKAAARHGLGLYLYEGEDLPEEIRYAQEELRTAKEEIINLGKELISGGIAKDTVSNIVAELNDGIGNPSMIDNIDVCEPIMAKMKELLKNTASENGKKVKK
jgi:hypothetical protein